MRKIGRYEIRGLLGRGGMSVVYKVRLPVTGRIAALKLLSPHPNLVALLGPEEIRKRFVAEAVTMAGLNHPHLVAVWDFDEHRGQPFFTMEYFCNNLGAVIGESYRVEKPTRILSPAKAAAYTRQILAGLARLHGAGIVHRDIKPFNILITDEDTVKISDFGLSKLRHETMARPGNLMVGSPFYAAPEQERNPEEVDARADLYSVGVILHRLLFGTLPGEGEAAAGGSGPPPDGEWRRFLEKATARDPEDRFPDAAGMVRGLEEMYRAWRERQEEICRLEPLPAPAPAAPSRLSLRSTPIKTGVKEGAALLALDDLHRPRQYVTNAFEERADGTILDRATGLLWERRGSEYQLTWDEALLYTGELSRQAFAGRTGWRLPTVAELASLLTAEPQGEEPCIEPIFDRSKKRLWSADRRSYTSAWYVSIDCGFVGWQDFTCRYYVRAVIFR